MLRASISLGKIAGVDVGIHYSMFALLGLVSWSLAVGFLPDHFRGWQTGVYWATGAVSALLLFASVLVHELAHSLLAVARGFPVHGITLFVLGGVSNLRAESRRPGDEFAISLIGPVTSLTLSAAFGLAMLGFLSGPRTGVELWFITLVHLDNSAGAAIVWYLALINLLLAVFNLLPAFPLDGGRLLRSALWALSGSFSIATRVATRGGQITGLGMMGLGVLVVLQANFLGGLWFSLIGWFLLSAATGSRRDLEV